MFKYKIEKRERFWAIVGTNASGERRVPHVGKPAYIQKLFDTRYNVFKKIS